MEGEDLRLTGECCVALWFSVCVGLCMVRTLSVLFFYGVVLAYGLGIACYWVVRFIFSRGNF